MSFEDWYLSHPDWWRNGGSHTTADLDSAYEAGASEAEARYEALAAEVRELWWPWTAKGRWMGLRRRYTDEHECVELARFPGHAAALREDT